MGQSHINSQLLGGWYAQAHLNDRRRGSKRQAPQRRLLAWFTRIGVAALVTFGSAVVVAGRTSPDIGELANKFEYEKSMAETYLPVLNSFDTHNEANRVELYAEGIRRYAEARAAFNGLITQLEVELLQSRPPNQSKAFHDKLNEAVARRIAFVSFVNDRLVPRTEGAQRGILDAFIKVSGELIKPLTDAGIAIWREFHLVGEARRKEIRQELESLRWPQFTAPSGK